MVDHTFSHADQLFAGKPYNPKTGKRGLPVTPFVQVDLGAPITLDVNGLIVAATSTELPDTETVTYTPANAGSSPVDGANQTWVLDVPRNITSVTTHSTSIVAMTIVVTGKDEYGVPVQETLSVTATGTSKVVDSLKTFKSVDSIAITAAGDAEANTLNMGWGDVLGLPWALAGEYDMIVFYADSTQELASATVLGADATDPATTTTNDVRGTVVPNTATDGSVNYRTVYKIKGLDTQENGLGVAQFGG
jgi:hypothetical protein